MDYGTVIAEGFKKLFLIGCVIGVIIASIIYGAVKLGIYLYKHLEWVN